MIREELTLKRLEKIEPNTIFAYGEAYDNMYELYMAGTGKMLRWVAVKGGINDWAIYCHFADKTWEGVAKFGDKVHDKTHIKRPVPCDEGAFSMYRH